MAYSFFGKNLDLSILNIANLGSGELRNLFTFINRFNSTKEFIFVWDNDYRINDNGQERDLVAVLRQCSKNSRVYIFEENSAGITKRGIENLFNHEVLDGYDGIVEQNGVKNKNRFFNHIRNRNNRNDFDNFMKFYEFITTSSVSNIK
ncbi:MAG: hypothetical protein WAV41_01880 [Microgenomates group bacterium]